MSVPKVIREAGIGASDAYVQTPPAEHIDVRDHGAHLDGSHDDRDAIQSALDEAAKSGTPDAVYLPAGTIRVGDQIYVEGRHSGVTICGAGSATHLRLDGGHTKNTAVFKIYARDDGPITGLAIRDLRIDCQKEKQTETHIRGITAIESGDGDDDNLVENVWFHDAVANNCHWGIPGTTFRYISSWGADRWHGIGISCSVDNADRPIVIEYSHFRENGTHGVDASAGHTVIRNVLSEENGWGGKNTRATDSSRWENVVFRNNEYLGYMQSGPANGPIEMDRVMARGNGWTGFRFAHGCSKLTIGEIVALENDTADKGQGNVYIGGPFPSISATSIKTGSSANANGFLAAEWSSGAPAGTVTELVHDGNNARRDCVNKSADLTIESTVEDSVSPLSIPTNPDSTSGGSTDGSYDHRLEIDGSNVAEYTEYAITVSDAIDHDSATQNAEDTVSGTTATGAVFGGADAYYFDGEITDATVTGDAENLVVRVDGSAVDLDTYLPPATTLEIDGSNVTEYTEYAITVSDAIDHDSATQNAEDSISGTTASGAVFGGLDAYYFDGEITDVTVTGDAENLVVRVDGSAVDLSQYVQPANVLEIAPSDMTEDQQDPIEFVVKTSGPIASETVESLTFYENDTVAVGFSYWWPTQLEFDGDVVEAHIPAGASVVLNGKQMAASEL